MTKELPNTIRLSRYAMDADAALRRGERTIQDAYNRLLQIEELAPVPTIIQQLTTAWIDTIITKKHDLINNDEMLTQAEKAYRHDQWDAIRVRAQKQIRSISTVLLECADAVWRYDEQHRNFVCDNFDEIVEKRATQKVPEEAQEHYTIIQQAIEQVRKLREWENAHDVKSQPLAYLQDLPQDSFCEYWIDGSVKYDRRFAYLGVNPQNFKDPKNPNRVII